MTGRMLVAGVGNIFLGDDGFGVAVANRLAGADLPGWVQVADYGISGVHLAYDLADGYETAILVDTAQRGEAPGTLTVIDVGLRGRLGQHGPARAASCDGTVAGDRGRPGQHGAARAASCDGTVGGDPAEPAGALAQTRMFDAHGMQPDVVLGVLDMLGASSARVLVVGCEPASLDYGMELSEPVAKAVDAAVQIVMDLIAASADKTAAPADT